MSGISIRTTLVSAALAAAALTASAGITDNIDKTFNVGAGGNVVVKTDFGDVDIRPGAAGTVAVHVDREAKTSDREDAAEEFRNFPISVVQRGNTIEVTGKSPHSGSFFNWGGSHHLRVHYVIAVPAQFSADVATSGGDIRIGSLAGTVRTNTSGGDIAVAQTAGPVTATTSGGNIRVDGASGAIEAGTSGGDIRVENAASSVVAKTSGGDIAIGSVAGDLLARTSGGNIAIQQASGGKVDAESSGGSITARFSAQPRSDSRLRTSGGSVEVYLPATAHMKIDAETSGGGVSTDLPVTVTGSHERDELHGTVNGGGPALVLQSSGGGIRIHKQ